MKLKWIDGKYNGSTAHIGPFTLDVIWVSSKAQYGFKLTGLSSTTSGFQDMNLAKEAAENELLKVLQAALEKLT